MNKLVLKSYAKLNLYLAVLNKRKDNYHNISTLFERIDLHDAISFEKLPDKRIEVVCNDPAVPPGPDNLCYKSAKLLQDKFDVPDGARIRIVKRIPAGAGLGGGSSNAAYTLIGLNKLWKLGLSKNKLLRLSRTIGADVTFFVMDVPFAQGSGRGDIIRPLKRLNNSRLWHIIAVPGVEVRTPRIYAGWDILQERKKNQIGRLTKPHPDVKLLPSVIIESKLFQRPDLLSNGLEEVTVGLYPEVKRIRERLSGFGVSAVLMSGSGPAVFGVVSGKRDGLSLAKRLKKSDRSLRIFVTTTW